LIIGAVWKFECERIEAHEEFIDEEIFEGQEYQW